MESSSTKQDFSGWNLLEKQKQQQQKQQVDHNSYLAHIGHAVPGPYNEQGQQQHHGKQQQQWQHNQVSISPTFYGTAFTLVYTKKPKKYS